MTDIKLPNLKKAIRPAAVLLLAGILSAALCACSSGTDAAAKEDAAVTSAEEDTTVDSVPGAEDPTPAAEDPAPAATEAATASGDIVAFSTSDIDGNPVTLADFADARLIMVNFWEPWCGPCVGEMPDLEKLYEEFADDGLVILGAFSDHDEQSARAIMDSAGTTYPVIRPDLNLARLQSPYVPTTVFLDAAGNILCDEPYIGSRDYAAWEEILKEYLA